MNIKLSAIVAADKNRVIGKNNRLPWRLNEDLRHFKEKTEGKAIIMGRNTWESIGRPLPNRRNIVLTSNKEFKAEGVEVFSSLADALAVIEPNTEAVVIGGETLYREALPLCDTLYYTQVLANLEGDAFFHINPDQEFHIYSVRNFFREDNDEKNEYDCVFIEYRRNV
jgi:dihydrofolate reductase